MCPGAFQVVILAAYFCCVGYSLLDAQQIHLAWVYSSHFFPWFLVARWGKAGSRDSPRKGAAASSHLSFRRPFLSLLHQGGDRGARQQRWSGFCCLVAALFWTAELASRNKSCLILSNCLAALPRLSTARRPRGSSSLPACARLRALIGAYNSKSPRGARDGRGPWHRAKSCVPEPSSPVLLRVTELP